MNALDYRLREASVLRRIPGAEEIEEAGEQEQQMLASKYPDAAFAVMIVDNVYKRTDRELSEIYGRAYASLLNDENIAGIRFRYDCEMEAYVRRHMWDD